MLLTLTLLENKQEPFTDDLKIHNSTMVYTHPGSKLTRVVLMRVKEGIMEQCIWGNEFIFVRRRKSKCVLFRRS